MADPDHALEIETIELEEELLAAAESPAVEPDVADGSLEDDDPLSQTGDLA